MPECRKMGWRREKLRDGIASVIERELHERREGEDWAAVGKEIGKEA
jgi:hypothetical protein